MPRRQSPWPVILRMARNHRRRRIQALRADRGVAPAPRSRRSVFAEKFWFCTRKLGRISREQKNLAKDAVKTMKIFRKAYELIFKTGENAKSVVAALILAEYYKRETNLLARERKVLRVVFELAAVRKHLKKCQDLKDGVLNTVADLRRMRDSYKEVTRYRSDFRRWSRASLRFLLYLPHIEQRARDAEQLCAQASISQRTTGSLVQRLNEEFDSFIALLSDGVKCYIGNETESKLRELLNDHKGAQPRRYI